MYDDSSDTVHVGRKVVAAEAADKACPEYRIGVEKCRSRRRRRVARARVRLVPVGVTTTRAWKE